MAEVLDLADTDTKVFFQLNRTASQSTDDTRLDAIYIEIQVSYDGGTTWETGNHCTVQNLSFSKPTTVVHHPRAGSNRQARLRLRTREDLRCAFDFESF